jgi:hypothetical protein
MALGILKNFNPEAPKVQSLKIIFEDTTVNPEIAHLD